MNSLNCVVLTLVAGTLLAACGSSSEGSGAGAASGGKPDVTLTVDGVHHVCNVALSSETHASSVACNDVVPFLRDELRVPNGARYSLKVDGKTDATELAAVSANLNGAGYRSVK